MSWKVGWDDGILQNDDVIAPVCRRRLDPHSLVQLQATGSKWNQNENDDLGMSVANSECLRVFAVCMTQLKCCFACWFVTLMLMTLFLKLIHVLFSFRRS